MPPRAGSRYTVALRLGAGTTPMQVWATDHIVEKTLWSTVAAQTYAPVTVTQTCPAPPMPTVP